MSQTSQFQPMPATVPRLIALLSAVSFFLQSASAVDVVIRRSDNVSLRGTITKMDTTSIVLQRTKKEEVTISVADIKAVQFDGEPSTMTQVRSNEGSGALDTALAKLEEVERVFDGTNKNAKPNLQFLKARIKTKQALTNPQLADEAIAGLQAFRSANQTSFRYLEATLLQASLHAMQKQTEEGKTLLTEVQNSAVPGFQLQAGVDLGKLLLTAGDLPAALQAFESVISQCEGKSALSGALYNATLGKAMCLLKQNQTDDAISTLDEVISKAPEAESATLASAWILKGDSLRQKNQAKAALMAYLHVDVLYSGEPVQHAEALMRLSELWGPSGHEDRAMEASARLAERYPNSPWARNAAGGG